MADATPEPQRFIYSDEDLQAFLDSPVKRDYLRFVSAMGNACSTSPWKYDPQTPWKGLSPALASFHGSLQVMTTWVDDIPPLVSSNNTIRFGNPAFRDWHERLNQRASSIVAAMLSCHQSHQVEVTSEYDEKVLQQSMEMGQKAAQGAEVYEASDTDSAKELVCYLLDAFGHPIRLDYGTGHESSLQVFLFTACMLHLFGSTIKEPPTAERLKAACLSIFHQYLLVTRRLQKDYRLEPAGSHGVWGLDDYYCLAFYFGACQLHGEEEESDLYPKSIHEKVVMRDTSSTYLYFGCIEFIQDIKQGVPFAESSPMLNDISNLQSWSKVASGLLKLYEGEVLKKRPVVQHFKFGEIFRATWTPSAPPKEPPSGTTTFHTKAPWAK